MDETALSRSDTYHEQRYYNDDKTAPPAVFLRLRTGYEGGLHFSGKCSLLPALREKAGNSSLQFLSARRYASASISRRRVSVYL